MGFVSLEELELILGPVNEAKLKSVMVRHLQRAKEHINAGKKPVFIAFERQLTWSFWYYSTVRAGSFRRALNWQWKLKRMSRRSVTMSPFSDEEMMVLCPSRLALYFEDGSTAPLSPADPEPETILAPLIESLCEALKVPYRAWDMNCIRTPPSASVSLSTEFETRELLHAWKRRRRNLGAVSFILLILYFLWGL